MASGVQHRFAFSLPGSLHSLSINPITGYPCSTSKAAATELSTPPLIATAILGNPDIMQPLLAWPSQPGKVKPQEILQSAPALSGCQWLHAANLKTIYWKGQSQLIFRKAPVFPLCRLNLRSKQNQPGPTALIINCRRPFRKQSWHD